MAYRTFLHVSLLHPLRLLLSLNHPSIIYLSIRHPFPVETFVPLLLFLHHCQSVVQFARKKDEAFNLLYNPGYENIPHVTKGNRVTHWH